MNASYYSRSSRKQTPSQFVNITNCIWGVRLRELKIKEKIQFVISEIVRGRLRECKTTKFVWELKRFFKHGGRR